MQHIVSVNKYDILCFTETWLQDVLDCDSLRNYYSVFQCNRPSRGGGVLVLCKLTYQCILHKTFLADGYEGVVVDVGPSGNHIRICCVYRTPSCSNEQSYQLHDTIRGVLSLSNNFVLIGDFNYPGINWLDDSYKDVTELSFINLINDLGGSQMVTKPTRKNAFLDLLIVSSPQLVDDTVTVNEPFVTSDHDSIEAYLFLKKPMVLHEHSQLKFLFNEVNFDLLHNFLMLQDWSDVYNASSAELKWFAFSDIVNNIISQFVPKKFILKHHNYRAPWSNMYLRRLYAKKKRLWRLFNRTLSVNVHTRYIACSRLYKSECELAKLRYEKQLFNDRYVKPAAFYEYISRGQMHRSALSSIVKNY